jgi:uncharacterized protein YeaO (DUF488 family)
MLNNFIVKKPEDSPKPKLVGLNTKCYAAIINKVHNEFPDAHFEIVMRAPNSVGLNCGPSELSPSYQLLSQANEGKITFEEYTPLLKQELLNNPKAIQRMQELREIAKSKLVFLVCNEKDPNQCHRSLLKEWIDHLDDFLAAAQEPPKNIKKIEFPELTPNEQKIVKFIHHFPGPFSRTIWTIANWCELSENEVENICQKLVLDPKYGIRKVRHYTQEYAFEAQ